MNKQQLDFLSRLIDAPSPSGYEAPAMRVIRAEAASFADDVKTDVHGNTDIVIHPGGAPRVMFAAHCDEIGFVVTHVDAKGSLWIAPVGGWDAQIPQGQRVRVCTAKGPIPGVIGKIPIHVQKPDDRKNATPLKDLWVDIGAKSAKEASRHVEIGDPIVVESGLVRLPTGLLAGRAFDDKAGAWAILEAARLLSKMAPKAEIHAVATVQEEIGSRGAVTAAFGIAPDVAIAVDVTFATDHPMMDDAARHEGEVFLGKGPVLTRGANVNPPLHDLIIATAKRKKIPIQRNASGRATSTDADPLQISRAGVATALLSIPLRYMHTPNEIVAPADLDATARLMAETVAAVRPGQSWIPV